MTADTVKPIGYSVRGVMFHSNGQVANNQRFNLYGEDKKHLGHGRTNLNGRFHVFIRTPASIDERISLTFRLCREVNLVSAHPNLKKEAFLCRNFRFYCGRMETAEAVETFVLKEMKISLGEVHLEAPYKEEQVPLMYTVDIAKAAIPSRITAFIESTREKIDFFNTHGINDVKKAFDISSTPLTAENTWKMLTNGICPLYLQEKGDYYIAKANFDRCEFDKLGALADVEVWFKKDGGKDPIMDRIEVRFRKTLHPSSSEMDYTPLKIYRPDMESFKEGLRIANCSFHVLGQTAFHLGIGHVYGSNAAIAAFDYLEGHPLGDLLLPHCRFIRKISVELGKAAIFDEDGVLDISALSAKGIATLISDSVAALDPCSFKPRAPINENHVFAKVQNLHYKELKKAVREYFDQHWDAITSDWKPVYGFFRRMFKRSPLYRPWGGSELKDANWRDTNEIGGNKRRYLPKRRRYRDGDEAVRSFRPIATDKNGPCSRDRKLIEKFIVDYIHHVTIWHSWIHRSQYMSTPYSPDAADVNFSPLTLSSEGKAEYGGISMEDAIHQLRIISLFHHFKVEHYTLVDGEGVYPGIVKRVKEAAENYLANGIDPYTELQVSTVI